MARFVVHGVVQIHWREALRLTPQCHIDRVGSLIPDVPVRQATTWVHQLEEKSPLVISEVLQMAEAADTTGRLVLRVQVGEAEKPRPTGLFLAEDQHPALLRRARWSERLRRRSLHLLLGCGCLAFLLLLPLQGLLHLPRPLDPLRLLPPGCHLPPSLLLLLGCRHPPSFLLLLLERDPPLCGLLLHGRLLPRKLLPGLLPSGCLVLLLPLPRLLNFSGHLRTPPLQGLRGVVGAAQVREALRQAGGREPGVATRHGGFRLRLGPGRDDLEAGADHLGRRLLPLFSFHFGLFPLPFSAGLLLYPSLHGFLRLPLPLGLLLYPSLHGFLRLPLPLGLLLEPELLLPQLPILGRFLPLPLGHLADPPPRLFVVGRLVEVVKPVLLRVPTAGRLGHQTLVHCNCKGPGELVSEDSQELVGILFAHHLVVRIGMPWAELQQRHAAGDVRPLVPGPGEADRGLGDPNHEDVAETVAELRDTLCILNDLLPGCKKALQTLQIDRQPKRQLVPKQLPQPLHADTNPLALAGPTALVDEHGDIPLRGVVRVLIETGILGGEQRLEVIAQHVVPGLERDRRIVGGHGLLADSYCLQKVRRQTVVTHGQHRAPLELWALAGARDREVLARRLQLHAQKPGQG
mmetsp:Transcript_64456/g.201840  ORF Transcript_64456/g.201840 Transcript_64456/m.201840 type:complete len:632 (-) Transcript_64456:12-1907(-)